MKLKKLQGMRDNERARPRRIVGDTSTRTPEQLHMMRTMRFARSEFVSGWSLTDAEIESIYEYGAKDLIERGGRVGPVDMSDWHTVQRLGWPCLKHGWSIVPQDRPGSALPDHELGRGAERRPSKIPVKSRNGGKEFYASFLPTQYRDRRMSLREFVGLEGLNGSNLAIQCCEASGHARGIDIDCTDEEIAQRVHAIAVETLGATPFVRFGHRPKLQLIYRVEGEDVAIRKWSVMLGTETEEPQSVEFLAEGSIITCYGLHHKTGLNFDWSEGALHPAIAGPEHAPVITKASLRAFVNALQNEWKVSGGGVTSNPYGSRSLATEFDTVSAGPQRIRTPRVIEGDWKVDANGDVLDGAEKWMTAQSWALCAANAEILAEVQAHLIDWLALEGKLRLMSTKRTNARYSSAEEIRREAAQKIRSASIKWRASIDHHRATGTYHKGVAPWIIGEDGRRPVAQRVKHAPRPTDGSMDWLPDDACPIPELADRAGAKVAIVEKTDEQISADRAARALIDTREERKRISDTVSVAVRGAIDEWLATVTDWSEEAPATPWVLKAPTGAGKTAGTIAALATWCRDNSRGPNQGPVLLVLPTHGNADEAMEKAVANGMFAPEYWSDEQLELMEQDLAGRGVKIARFRGRLASNCQQADKMKALSEKGIGASGLCGADVEIGTEPERRLARKAGEKLEKVELLCRFREAGECGYFNQLADLQNADVVVLPHAYLTIGALPKALRKPRAVVIDESVTYALLRQTKMPVSTLAMARREPYVTDVDRAKFATWDDKDIKQHYFTQREELCALAAGWLAKGLDVAVELAMVENGRDLLASAILVCDRANDRSRKVRPDMSMAAVEKLTEEATGRFILAEIQFWKLVRDRMDRLAAGTAKGPRDMRWQIVEDREVTTPATDTAPAVEETTPHLRLSWRVTPNWIGRPTLLLDASANERIVAKLYADSPMVRKVEAPMYVRTIAMVERTWSNSSFIPAWDATGDQIKAAADTIEKARRLITTMSVLYGHGRLLVGSTIAVREIIVGGGWTPPPNVDFTHFGNLRGLDFAKHHVAAISIGRSEQPIQVIDGYAAALTFDDDAPEEPYDILGNGIRVTGMPLFRPPGWKRIMMRTGQDLDHFVPSMPPKARMKDGKQELDAQRKPVWDRSWGQELEESWREEELKQFVGRLRPVYRGVEDDLPPPVWLAVGKVLPDEVVVDELVEMESVLQGWPMAELVRIGGGVLSENVTPSLPGAQVLLQGRSISALAKDLPDGKTFLHRWVAPFQHARYSLPSEGTGLSRSERSAMLLAGWIDGDPTDYFSSLSERHGERPEMLRVVEAKLQIVEGRAKTPDKRDVDRDDARLAELELLQAHRAEPLAGEHTRVEFELRRARGLYEAVEDDDADPDPEPPPAVAQFRRFGLPAMRGSA